MGTRNGEGSKGIETLKYDVLFSLEAATELLRIMGELGAVDVLRASKAVRDALEDDPASEGTELSEGLFYVDLEPIRVFFLIDVEEMRVEVTDFRIL